MIYTVERIVKIEKRKNKAMYIRKITNFNFFIVQFMPSVFFSWYTTKRLKVLLKVMLWVMQEQKMRQFNVNNTYWVLQKPSILNAKILFTTVCGGLDYISYFLQAIYTYTATQVTLTMFHLLNRFLFYKLNVPLICFLHLTNIYNCNC